MPFQNRLSSAMVNHKLDGSLPANPADDRRKANAVTLKSSGVARGGGRPTPGVTILGRHRFVIPVKQKRKQQ